METVTEVWKTVNGYPGYEVSNLGRVKSMKQHKSYPNGKILKQPLRKGYFSVVLCHANKVKSFRVNRLVYMVFKGDLKGLTVDHINSIKSDNRPENLQLLTNGENSSKAWKDGLNEGNKGTGHKLSKLTDSIVIEARRRRGEGEKLTYLAREYGVDRKTLRNAITGRGWKHIDAPTVAAEIPMKDRVK